MTDEQPIPSAELDASILEAARAAGFMFPEDVVRLLPREQLQFDRTTGQPLNLERVVRQFKLDRPAYLDVDSAGVPRSLDGDPHGSRGRGEGDEERVPHDPGPRAHGPDGKFVATAPSAMNDALHALMGNERAEEDAVRLARLVTHPPDPEPGPSAADLNEASRRLVLGEPGSNADWPTAIRSGLERRHG